MKHQLEKRAEHQLPSLSGVEVGANLMATRMGASNNQINFGTTDNNNWRQFQSICRGEGPG